MDRPPRQEGIIEVLREVQLRLSQGESLTSICKSLGISPSSYRRWRRMYGERVIENAVATANESSEQRASAPPTSTENILTKPAGARSNGNVPELSEEAKRLLDEANGASDPARSAWLAFLALLTYLLVTLASVGHKDLLLNSPVGLPLVNVDIPIFGFFQYAPALLLLVYLSLLIQHIILARKYRKFTEAIAPYEKETGKQHPARELVHSYVVSQILAGPKPNLIRSGLMRLIVFVTFTLLPVVTLLYFQVKFLPYHEVWVTYWHRIAVVIALATLFGVLPLMYPRSRKQEITIGPQEEPWHVSRVWISCSALLAIFVLFFSWLIATVPDERIDQAIGFIPPTSVTPIGLISPMSMTPLPDEQKLLNPLVRFLCERTPEAVGWLSPCRVFPLRWLSSYRVLVVEDRDLVPDEGDKQNEVSVPLRDRDLRFALLSRSDLHRADLTNADLRAAQMWRTRVDNAKLRGTQLQGAFLSGAQLQGADLKGAGFDGADLSNAELRGADLKGAQLLKEAQLRGADFKDALLQGVDLSNAQLQFADLSNAQLQGADLRNAQLQFADLKDAQLRGADLEGAQLQGADLEGAQLQGADLASAEVSLVKFPPGLANQSPAPLGLTDLKMASLTADAKAKLKRVLEANITDPTVSSVVNFRLDRILRRWEEGSWKEYVSKAKEPSADELAQFHADLACDDAEGYIANSMAVRVKEFETEHFREGYAKAFASALLDENCKGRKALTYKNRAALENLASAPE
jgi:uncharacterized protein YjbI with pentapeptide repeats/transposase-like protein